MFSSCIILNQVHTKALYYSPNNQLPVNTWTYSSPQQHHFTVSNRSSNTGRLHPPFGHPVEEEEEKAASANHS